MGQGWTAANAGRILTLAIFIPGLTSCGGGSGNDEEPGAMEHTIGGSVSGLVGTLVLQNNGGDDLSVTENGSFSFSGRLETGDSYSVTILTPPKGQDCAVSGGAGSVSADVTDVAITCSNDESAFHLAVRAAALGDVGGFTGLYAFDSKAMGAAPTRIVDGDFEVLGYALSGEGVPRSFAYFTRGAAGGDHVWAVDMSGTSTLEPRRLTSLALDPDATPGFCSNYEFFEDLGDPASAVYLIEVPGTADCDHLTATTYLVRLTDAADAEPTELPGLYGRPLPLYAPSGELGGIVLADGAGNLNFYADATLTSPVVLLTGVDSFRFDYPSKRAWLAEDSGTQSFALISVEDTNGAWALYRVDHTGAISAKLYDVQGDHRVGYAYDATHLYFTDDVFSGLQHFVRVALDGATPAATLHSHDPGDPGRPGPMRLWDVVEGRLLFSSWQAGSSPTQPVYDIYNLPFDDFNDDTVLASTEGLLDVRLVGNYVLIAGGDQPPSRLERYSTQVVSLDGDSVQPVLHESMFISLGESPIIQLREIAEDAGYGGAGVRHVTLEGGAVTAEPFVQESDGAPFIYPMQTGKPFAASITPDLAVGGATFFEGDFLLVYDLAGREIATISMPNTSLEFIRSSD